MAQLNPVRRKRSQHIFCVILSRPINPSQRVSPVACTAMTRCGTAYRIPSLLIRYCDGRMKVPLVDMATMPDIARPESPTVFEERMVSLDEVILLLSE